MGNASKSNRKERFIVYLRGLQLMLAFGSFLLTLISLVVAIVILNNKK
ncbi:putative holin-like toxin [Streptococcus equi subsp. equi]|nr:putative holin-like toxin [Streptococcus equi subsp. equi]